MKIWKFEKLTSLSQGNLSKFLRALRRSLALRSPAPLSEMGDWLQDAACLKPTSPLSDQSSSQCAVNFADELWPAEADRIQAMSAVMTTAWLRLAYAAYSTRPSTFCFGSWRFASLALTASLTPAPSTWDSTCSKVEPCRFVLSYTKTKNRWISELKLKNLTVVYKSYTCHA